MKRVSVQKFFEAPAGTLFYISEYTGDGGLSKYSPLFVKGENFTPRQTDQDAYGRHISLDLRCTYQLFGVPETVGQVRMLDCSTYMPEHAVIKKNAKAPPSTYGSPYMAFLLLESTELESLAKQVTACQPTVRKVEAPTPIVPSTLPLEERRKTRIGTHVDRINNTVPAVNPRLTHNLRGIHPGIVLQEEFLTPLGIEVVELTHRLGADFNEVQNILDGASPITPAMALRLEAFFRTTADYWINLQKEYDLKSLCASAEADGIIHGIVPWPRGAAGELIPRV